MDEEVVLAEVQDLVEVIEVEKEDHILVVLKDLMLHICPPHCQNLVTIEVVQDLAEVIGVEKEDHILVILKGSLTLTDEIVVTLDPMEVIVAEVVLVDETEEKENHILETLIELQDQVQERF